MIRSRGFGRGVSRRAFLAGAAALAGGLTRTASAATRARGGVPGDRLRVAIVGAGGRGGDDTADLAATGLVDIVALCDVDERQAADAFKKLPRCQAVLRLATAARHREGHRRRDGGDARSQSRHHLDCGDAPRQACLLREAARAQHLGSARDGTRRGEHGPGDADGHAGARVRRHARGRRSAAGRHDRRRHGAARLDRSPRGLVAARRHPAGGDAAGSAGARLGRLARPAPQCGRTTRPTSRSSGAASGTSAPARSATWGSTTSTPRTGASSWARRRRSRSRTARRR